MNAKERKRAKLMYRFPLLLALTGLVLLLLQWALGFASMDAFGELLPLVQRNWYILVLPVALLRCMTSPLLPLSVLLTVWILRRSADGCPTFTAWFSQTKRLVLTGAVLLATGLGSALSLILAMQPTPYKARLQFPLQNLFSSVSGGMSRWNTSCALSLILYSVGILLVMALTSVLLMERRKLFRTEA